MFLRSGNSESTVRTICKAPEICDTKVFFRKVMALIFILNVLYLNVKKTQWRDE